jgi:hypothetical protein
VHDCHGEGDVSARGDGKLLDVEGGSRLVIAESRPQVSLYASIPFHCGGEVEHHDVRLVMGEDGGYIVPTDSSARASRRALIRISSVLSAYSETGLAPMAASRRAWRETNGIKRGWRCRARFRRRAVGARFGAPAPPRQCGKPGAHQPGMPSA